LTLGGRALEEEVEAAAAALEEEEALGALAELGRRISATGRSAGFGLWFWFCC